MPTEITSWPGWRRNEEEDEEEEEEKTPLIKANNPHLACEEYILIIAERSLEVKLKTIWTDERHRQEEAQAWRKSERRR